MPGEPNEEKPLATFEASLQELEMIVRQLEAGDLPLERALALFETGIDLSQKCRGQLEEAETRVEILLKKNNRIQPQPFLPDKE
jgi:exodeoxyribonuclease VII small subunit